MLLMCGFSGLRVVAVVMPGVVLGIVFEAVAANEPLPQSRAGFGIDLGSDYGIHRGGKGFALRQAGIMQLKEGLIGPDDPVTVEIVAQRQGGHARHRRVPMQHIEAAGWYVAGGLIDMKHAR